MNPKGKVALVTGGAHRVGKAIVLALARAGADVVVNYDSSDADARQTVAEAEALGVAGMAVQCDVSDLASVQGMVAAIRERFGRVDILVNSASLFGRISFPTEDVETWHRVTRISIDGAFYVSNEIAPMMLAAGEGAIVNIIDLSATQPWPNYTAHAVGKAGLLALTNQMALELAPTVRVNAVCPGPVLAPEGYTQPQLDRIASHTLLKRWGRGEDVAQAVRFLVEADYITADVIHVDGGERFGHRKR
ncbi:MAG: SDR family oxidoreductase [Caldilineaceae bacterium]|nr:SDR family oxidoreductase [Caldilineaceae bacterium]MBP9074705.1 SDR family oxidoreductase [Caldilineaceae bacterium]